LLTFAAEHRRIQIQGKARFGAGQQTQEPAPKRTLERLDLPLGKTQEKVADGVIAGKAPQP
jgi:hypothetical protein